MTDRRAFVPRLLRPPEQRHDLGDVLRPSRYRDARLSLSAEARAGAAGVLFDGLVEVRGAPVVDRESQAAEGKVVLSFPSLPTPLVIQRPGDMLLRAYVTREDDGTDEPETHLSASRVRVRRKAGKVALGEVQVPTWDELVLLRSLVWHDEDPVFQILPPASSYFSHTEALHLHGPMVEPADVAFRLLVAGVDEELARPAGLRPVAGVGCWRLFDGDDDPTPFGVVALPGGVLRWAFVPDLEAYAEASAAAPGARAEVPAAASFAAAVWSLVEVAGGLGGAT